MKRDRREDPGQYYPGGRVVPKTPTGQGGGGTSDYDQLANKPKINNHELTGNKTAEQLGLATPSDIPDVLGKLPMRPLPKYLHFLPFDDTYPADAKAFYDSVGSARVMGGCSIVRKGNLVGGNFDYPYDDACSFAIKVSAAKGANADGSDRHASVGAAYLGTRLTENIVSSGVSTPLYRVLPGMTESGINDAGVYAKINVIPRDQTKDPVQSETRNLHALAVVRYVLDHFDNAVDAVAYVASHYYIPEGSQDSYHWMIADKDGSYVVEDGYDFGPSIALLTNYRIGSGGDTYGQGYRRHEIIEDMSYADVAELLEAVMFTNAYATGWPWPDEFAGQTDAQGKIPHDATERLKAWANEHVAPLLDANRKPAARGNGCWQTVHSAIYDFEKKTMAICVQEDFSKRYVFAVDQANVDLSPIEAQIEALQDGKRDTTDLSAYAWTGDSIPADADGQPYWSESEGFWIWNRVGTMLVYITRDDPGNLPTNTSRTFSDPDGVIAPFAAHIGEVSKLAHTSATSGIAKFGENGELTQAEKSSTSDDPANADYRDPQDNTCHKTEFTEWETTDSRYGVRLAQTVQDLKYWEPYRISDGGRCGENKGAKDAVLVSWNIGDYEGDKPLTATRAAVCSNNKRFVTEDVAAKQSDIPALAAPSETSTDEQAAKARATYDFVNSSINAMAAFYITKNAAGDSFATKAELTSAIASGTFYNGGQPRTPTKNDYLYILADESHPTAAGTSPTTRYSFDGTQWSFQIVVNDTALTAAQLAAMNSGINSALVEWLTTFKGTDSATTLVSILAAIAGKANQSDIFGSDGKPTDTFATNLLGKQVANAKVRYALATASSATMADRTVNILTMTQSETLTFPTATTHDNKTYARDFLLKLTYTAGTMELPQGVTKVGDELSFEAGKTYLIAFTEIAADKFYVRAIDITEAQA